MTAPRPHPTNPPESREASRDQVAAIVRDLLRSQSAEREVPPLLVEAVVDGTGDRETVRTATLTAYGPEKPFDLVLFDTDRIAGYVFESSRPPVIAGASLLLRELNEQIGQDYGKWTIFSGGGEGLLLVPHGLGPKICQVIRDRYRERTAGALSVTTDFLEVSPEDFLSIGGEAEPLAGTRLVSGTQAVLSRLRDKVRKQKDENPPFREPVPGGAERCASCRDRRSTGIPMPRKNDEGLVEGTLCSPCWERWQKGRREIEGVSFDDLVERFTEAYPALGGKSRYLGFLYADGNSMGALFGRLSTLAEIRFVSRAVAHVFAAAQQQTERAVQTLVAKVPPQDRLFLSYLGGGDEAIWILPGALAVHVAAHLSKWIETEAGTIAGLPKITLGIGLVLCQHGYPVRYQYDLAKSLLKSAKGMFQGARPEEIASSLDFELLTDSSPLSDDLTAVRTIAYQTEENGFLRTCRPYSADRFDTLVDRMRKARETGLAASQLYALQAGAVEGRDVFLNYLRYQIARGMKSYGPWLEGIDPASPRQIEDFFVEPTGTWIADGLQLLPFLDQIGKLNQGESD
jgi:hypothetical protein